MNATAEPTPRHDPDLLNRWLDGLASPEEEAALVRSVEADPAATAALVDALLLEAELRPLLAPATERPVLLRPRFATRKWLTAAALAACVAVAAVWGVRHFQPATDPGGIAIIESSDGRLKITRYSNGRHPAQRDWPAIPVAAPNGPLVVKKYETNWGAPRVLEIPGLFSSAANYAGMVRVKGLNSGQQTPEGKLAAYLRWHGVEMPEGAWVRSLEPQLESHRSIELCTNAEGHRLAGMILTTGQNHDNIPTVRVQPWIYLGTPGTPLPEPLATEHITTREAIEKLMLAKGMNRQGSTRCVPEADWRFILRTRQDARSPGNASYENLHQLDITSWRTGESTLRLMGACGPPPEPVTQFSNLGDSCPPLTPEETDLEFDLTLQEGDVAVLHTGTLADGSPCILLLEATISSYDPLNPEAKIYRQERITDQMYRR